MEQLLCLFLAAVALAAAARHLRAPYPVFLALGGALLAFFPGGPKLSVPPDLALALFVAPVLLDAAYDTSLRDLRAEWVAVTALVVFAVGLTTLAVALVVKGLMPAVGWPAAIALGAVVAPPDAVAATAVLRPLKPPQRILTILEGESLLNDAVALMIYRLAVGGHNLSLVDSLDSHEQIRYFWLALAVLATVMLVRFAWHMSFNAVVRWRHRRYGFHPPRPMLRPSVGSGLLISWAGMRGIVTLAAAMALPTAFPQRGLIVFTAFAVVLGTLTLQGLTLKPLLRRLNLHDGDPVGQEVAMARQKALQAALASIDQVSPMAELVRREFQMRLGTVDSADGQVRRQALRQARQTVLDMRTRQEIGDDAFHRVEEELDWLEMADRSHS